MHVLTKAFISGAAGALVASYVEPKLTALLPSVDPTSWETKAIHYGVAGGSAAAVFMLLGHKA